jgi:protein RecA
MSSKKAKKREDQQISSGDILSQIRSYLKSEDSYGQPRWFLSTGNLALDYIISGRVNGSGGWPAGRICEVFGDPSTGKTVLLEKAGASVQMLPEGIFVVADTEDRWDEAYARIHGVDPERMIRYVPETIEEFGLKTLDILDKFGDGNKLLFVLDSLAAINTEKELKDLDAGNIILDRGLRARTIRATALLLPKRLHERDAIMLISNHTYSVVGAYVPTKTTGGGRAFPYLSSVRIELTQPKEIKAEGKDRPLGVSVEAKVTKSSIQPPFGKAHLDMYWTAGIPKYSGLLDIALDLGIIEQKGSYYYWDKKAFYAKDFDEVITANPDILKHPSWENPYFKEARC